MVLLLLLLCVLNGCSFRSDEGNRGAEDATQQESEQENIEDEQIYILLYSNTDTQKLFMEGVENGRQEEFRYTGGTYIRDIYGSSITVSQLQNGDLVRISYTEDNKLTEVELAKDVFVYDEVTNFSIDKEKDMLTIGESNYYYDENLKVFSGAELISLNEVSQQDEICIRGIDKKILTLSVVRGHGTVVLRNTETFEGGMITIGNVIAQEITEDMVLEVPEGTYTLSVANDGYGGSRELVVERFQEQTIDLNTLKGEGPSYCHLWISVIPENALVTLAGSEVDCSHAMEIRYGTYQLAAEAEGYVPWGGTLVVNSEEASLTIELEEEEEESEEETDSKEDEDTKSEDEQEDTSKEESEDTKE